MKMTPMKKWYIGGDGTLRHDQWQINTSGTPEKWGDTQFMKWSCNKRKREVCLYPANKTAVPYMHLRND